MAEMKKSFEEVQKFIDGKDWLAVTKLQVRQIYYVYLRLSADQKNADNVQRAAEYRERLAKFGIIV